MKPGEVVLLIMLILGIFGSGFAGGYFLSQYRKGE